MKLLFTLLLCFACSANALQFKTERGVIEGSALVNTKTGAPELKQDTISNPKSGQLNREPAFVLGRRTNLDNNRCDLWEGPTCKYVFPAAPTQMRIVSTSANDAAGNTGVRLLTIDYLDTNYIERSETVVTAGLTPVTTVSTNILRVNRMHSDTVGSNGSAVGVLSLTDTAGTVTYSVIPSGFVASRQAIYTVPAAKSFYVSHWQASSGAPTGSHFTIVSARATSFNGITHAGVFASFDETGSLNNGIAITLPIPVMVPEKVDMKLTAVSDAANAGVTALGTLMGWLEDN